MIHNYVLICKYKKPPKMLYIKYFFATDNDMEIFDIEFTCKVRRQVIPRGSVYFFLEVPVAITILSGCIAPACVTTKKTFSKTLGMT